MAPTAKPSGLDVREDLSDDFAEVGCAEWAATGEALTILPECVGGRVGRHSEKEVMVRFGGSLASRLGNPLRSQALSRQGALQG